MIDMLIRLKENELRDKQNWLKLIKFYNHELDKHFNMHSFFYRLREKAVNEVQACDIQIQYLDMEIRDE